jgi:hypothetical protein
LITQFLKPTIDFGLEQGLVPLYIVPGGHSLSADWGYISPLPYGLFDFIECPVLINSWKGSPAKTEPRATKNTITIMGTLFISFSSRIRKNLCAKAKM